MTNSNASHESAASEHIQHIAASDITTAPPQPPLRGTDDEAVPLPAIVHGIDPDDAQEPASDPGPAPFLSQTGLTDVINSLSERVQRVVRLASPTPMPDALASSAVTPPPTLFLFGDSITTYSVSTTQGAPGWGTLLRADYATTADVIVRGHSGYNTRWALYVLARELRALIAGKGDKHPIKLATIFLGANDACEPTSDLYVPVTEYASNLATMVTFVRSLGIMPLLICPPPVTPVALTIGGSRTLENTGTYAKACNSVASNLKCPVLDLYTAFLKYAAEYDDLEMLFVDGLHLSTEGNKLVHELVKKKIAEIAPELRPDHLQPFAPPIDEVDPKDLIKTFGESELVPPSS